MTTSAPSPGAFSIIRTFEAGTQSSLRCNLTGAMGASEMQLEQSGKSVSSYFNGFINSVVAWPVSVCLSSPMNLIAVTVSRGDVIGYFFGLLAVFFTVLGYALSRVGLKADADAQKVKQAADAAQTAAAQAQQTAANAQQSIVEETGDHAQAVANSSAQVASATNVIQDEISNVNEALGQLTGNQAPARVMWAIAVLCLLSALVSFDLISSTVGSDAGNTAASAGQ